MISSPSGSSLAAQPLLTPSIPIPPPKPVVYAETAGGAADFTKVKAALQVVLNEGSPDGVARITNIWANLSGLGAGSATGTSPIVIPAP